MTDHCSTLTVVAQWLLLSGDSRAVSLVSRRHGYFCLYSKRLARAHRFDHLVFFLGRLRARFVNTPRARGGCLTSLAFLTKPRMLPSNRPSYPRTFHRHKVTQRGGVDFFNRSGATTLLVQRYMYASHLLPEEGETAVDRVRYGFRAFVRFGTDFPFSIVDFCGKNWCSRRALFHHHVPFHHGG